MNAIKNLTDVLSNSLTTTLDVEYKGYLQYVQILKRHPLSDHTLHA